MRDLLNGHAPPTTVLYVLRPTAGDPAFVSAVRADGGSAVRAPVIEQEYVGLTPDRTMTDTPLQCVPPQPESVLICCDERRRVVPTTKP